MIFSVNFDGRYTRTYGGTTFIISAGVGGSMQAEADYGIGGGWGGIRATKALVEKFETADKRGRFHTDGQKLEINNPSVFTDGYPLIKFKNITSTGQIGSDTGKAFVDTDFPLFRLADAYLIYAEAAVRGGGDTALALTYVNDLRKRAGASTISAAALTLDFILDERARELAWEGHRRTDLIRHGKFTSGYTWPWKGGSKDGVDVASYRALYPIPARDLTANPNLVQNPGY